MRVVYEEEESVLEAGGSFLFFLSFIGKISGKCENTSLLLKLSWRKKDRIDNDKRDDKNIFDFIAQLRYTIRNSEEE